MLNPERGSLPPDNLLRWSYFANERRKIAESFTFSRSGIREYAKIMRDFNKKNIDRISDAGLRLLKRDSTWERKIAGEEVSPISLATVALEHINENLDVALPSAFEAAVRENNPGKFAYEYDVNAAMKAVVFCLRSPLEAKRVGAETVSSFMTEVLGIMDESATDSDLVNNYLKSKARVQGDLKLLEEDPSGISLVEAFKEKVQDPKIDVSPSIKRFYLDGVTWTEDIYRAILSKLPKP
ncbi:MAG: hypothetical protein Q8P26_03505 [Candidatus Levybacteria bacterium]|nr:hypothetical protein [Candidatus Levybacteria bacterium]